MSQVLWLACDTPPENVELPSGFMVYGPSYYAGSPDLPAWAEKALPCRCDIYWGGGPEALADMGAYLARHIPPGGNIELWGLWIGAPIPRRRAAEAAALRRGIAAQLTAPGPAGPPQVMDIRLDGLERRHLDMLADSDGLCLRVSLP